MTSSYVKKKGTDDALSNIILPSGKINRFTFDVRVVCDDVYEIFNKACFIALDAIYPECGIYTKESRIPRLFCFLNQVCDKGNNCQQRILNRLEALNTSRPEWVVFILYWRIHPQNPKSSLIGAVFCKESIKEYVLSNTKIPLKERLISGLIQFVTMFRLNRYSLDRFLGALSTSYTVTLENHY